MNKKYFKKGYMDKAAEELLRNFGERIATKDMTAEAVKDLMRPFKAKMDPLALGSDGASTYEEK